MPSFENILHESPKYLTRPQSLFGHMEYVHTDKFFLSPAQTMESNPNTSSTRNSIERDRRFGDSYGELVVMIKGPSSEPRRKTIRMVKGIGRRAEVTEQYSRRYMATGLGWDLELNDVESTICSPAAVKEVIQRGDSRGLHLWLQRL